MTPTREQVVQWAKGMNGGFDVKVHQLISFATLARADLVAQLAERDAEIARLKEDAERYHWLRGKMDSKDVSIIKMRNDPNPTFDEGVDAAIDKARSGE